MSGITPADLREDLSALKELTNRLQPFLGNLIEVHRGITVGKQVIKDTPTLSLSIEAWQNEGFGAVYGLADLQAN